MKLKLSIIALFGAFAVSANAANYNISNVVDGVSDTLYTNTENQPLASGIVTLGVFTAGFNVEANLGNIPLLIANFTNILASGTIGGPSATLGGNFAGYAESPTVDNPNLGAADPLVGRTIYSFVGNSATLGASTAFALLNMGTILVDDPTESDYSSNPQARVGAPLIGVIVPDSVSGNFGGQGPGTYDALQLVPEPSAALLGLLGAVGLIRRRR